MNRFVKAGRELARGIDALARGPFVVLALRWGVGVIAVGFILVFIAVAVVRLPYPFELEWMEGAMVDHVRRILSGDLLYVEPSVEFIPFIYTPLYFYVSAFLSWFIGTGFVPLRLVSLLSTFGSFTLIYYLVRRETGSNWNGVLAMGLFAATFSISGYWFDLARVDSFYLFLLLLTACLVRFGESSRALAFAGLIGALAFLTKQTALLTLLPLMGYLLYRDRKHLLYFAGISLGLIAVSTLVLEWIHDGWYSFYIFELPRGHPMVRSMLLDFWRIDLLLPMGIGVSLSLFFLAAKLHDRKWNLFLFYGLFAGGMVCQAWSSRLHSGGYLNVLIPAHAALAILVGLAVGEISARLKDSRSGQTGMAVQATVLMAVIIQFAVLLYNPRYQIPSTEDAVAGVRLVRLIESIEGEVLVPYHGYLSAMAGKATWAHEMAILDVLRGRPHPAREKLSQDIRNALAERRFEAVIIDQPWWLPELQASYEYVGEVIEGDGVFLPRTGARRRPQSLYQAADFALPSPDRR